MAVDLAVVHAHAQWWSPDPKPKMEASPSATAEGVDGAISAWVANECNRFSGEDLTLGEEDVHAHSKQAGKPRELEAWGKFDVCSPHEA